MEEDYPLACLAWYALVYREAAEGFLVVMNRVDSEKVDDELRAY